MENADGTEPFDTTQADTTQAGNGQVETEQADTEPFAESEARDLTGMQQEVMDSFYEFESSFRKKYPSLWLLTLLTPPVATTLILVAIGLSAGLDQVKHFIVGAFCAFFFFGRFSIPFVDTVQQIDLTRGQAFMLVTYMDVMVALIIPFHMALLYRIPLVGPKVGALVADGQFILAKNAWMKRASFIGLILFVMFPLAATGSVGGAIFARLLGMSRLASIIGITMGSLMGNGVMYAFAGFISAHIDPDNKAFTYGGIAVIVLIIVILERRYRKAKKRYLATQVSGTATK